MNRVLIIQTAFLGDVILTLPLVQLIRKSFEDVQIDFLAIPETADVVKPHPDISQVLIYDKHGSHSSFSDFLQLRGRLRKRVYNYVFCPHRSVRSALLARGTRAATRVGFDRSALPGSFTHVVTWKFGVHEIDRNLSLLRAVGIDAQREEPKLYPGGENREEVARFLATNGVEPPYAVVAPGTVWKTKQYPIDRMAKVVGGLLTKFQSVVLIGGIKDGRIAGSFGDQEKRVVSAIGEFSFMSSAELIRRSSLLVANDSAPIHVASAFGVPTVAIFGPTVKDFGFYPYHEASKVVEAEALNCRPCTIHGSDRCPIGTFECMRSIRPEGVVEEGFRLLEKMHG